MSSCDTESSNGCSESTSTPILSQEIFFGLPPLYTIIGLCCLLLLTCALCWYWYYCKRANRKGKEKAGIGDLKTPSEDLEDLWQSPELKPGVVDAPSFSLDVCVDLYEVSETGIEMQARRLGGDVSLFEDSSTGTSSIIGSKAQPQQRSSLMSYQEYQAREAAKFFWKGESAYQLDGGGSFAYMNSPYTPSVSQAKTLTPSTRDRVITFPRVSAESVEGVNAAHQKRFLQHIASSFGLYREPEVKRQIATQGEKTDLRKRVPLHRHTSSWGLYRDTESKF